LREALARRKGSKLLGIKTKPDGVAVMGVENVEKTKESWEVYGKELTSTAAGHGIEHVGEVEHEEARTVRRRWCSCVETRQEALNGVDEEIHTTGDTDGKLERKQEFSNLRTESTHDMATQCATEGRANANGTDLVRTVMVILV